MVRLALVLALAFAVVGILGYTIDRGEWKFAGDSDILVKNGSVEVLPPIDRYVEFREARPYVDEDSLDNSDSR
jgi:hypothetical protein